MVLRKSPVKWIKKWFYGRFPSKKPKKKKFTNVNNCLAEMGVGENQSQQKREGKCQIENKQKKERTLIGDIGREKRWQVNKDISDSKEKRETLQALSVISFRVNALSSTLPNIFSRVTPSPSLLSPIPPMK